MEHVAIAIDGPAASGKSSVARRIARHFGFLFVNSGAMYRAFTWWVLEHGVDPSRPDAVRELLARTTFDCGVRDGQSTIGIGGREVTESQLHREDVNRAVSAVSALPEVRARLVAEQRRFLDLGSLVMEGRDIGTVVFPESPHKFYLDAAPEIRRLRRSAQGIDDDVLGRDSRDRSRRDSPLRVAADARVIDTSRLGIDDVVRRIVGILEANGVRPLPLEPMTPIYRFCHTACKAFFHAAYAMEVHHAERARIPGGAYLASNHASFLDPPLVGTALDEPIRYLARNTLFKPPLLSWLLPRLNTVPVDRDNAELSSLRLSIELVRQGKKMVVFPEGTRTPDGTLQPAQRGVGMLVAKTGAPVIPVRIFGSFEAFPRSAKFPRWDGKVHVVFGEPLRFSPEEREAKGKAGQQAISDRILAAIAALRIPGDEGEEMLDQPDPPAL
jgi:cytidylate kinase